MLKVKCSLNPGRITLRAYVEGGEAILRINRTSVSLNQKLDNDITDEARNIMVAAQCTISELFEKYKAEGHEHLAIVEKIVDEMGIEEDGSSASVDGASDDGTFTVPTKKSEMSEELVELLTSNKRKFSFSKGNFKLFGIDGESFQVGDGTAVLVYDEESGELNMVAEDGSEIEITKAKEAEAKPKATRKSKAKAEESAETEEPAEA